MNALCIYHSVDLDGWMSAAIVNLWFESGVQAPDKTIEFIGWNYGDPIPDYSEYSHVIVCDVSFPKETMENINKCHSFVWIDHHVSAIQAVGDIDCAGIRRTDFAACELAWMHFFPEKPVPELVRLLGMYDCFRHKGTFEESKVLEFQYGARAEIHGWEQAYFYLKYLNSDLDILTVHNKGVTIYRYLLAQAKDIYKRGFQVVFMEGDIGRKFICFNTERFNPVNFGIDYHADGYDGAACFHYKHGSTPKWMFSIYNDNGMVDCSVIAKALGGGGHKGASGFILDTENFLKLTQ